MKKYFALLLIASSSWAQDVIIEDGLRAFETTLYPALRQSCTKCHGDGGIAIGHSVSDLRQAYLNAKQLVDFSALPASRFVSKVRAKHWLKYDSKELGMEVPEMIAHLENWWKTGESKANMKFALTSKPIEIPEVLPEMKDNQFLTLQWDILSEQDSPLCTASVDIQRAMHGTKNYPGAYRVKYPKLTCKGDDMRVRGLYFAVSNEIKNFENIYSDISVTVPGSSYETLLSSEIMILIQRNPVDTISFLIRDVEGR